ERLTRSERRWLRSAPQRSCSLPISLHYAIAAFGGGDVTTESRAALQTARPFLFHSMPARSTQPQNFTVPGFTPAQTSALVIQPLSTITLRFSLVTGSGVSRMPLTLTPLAPPVNGFTSG